MPPLDCGLLPASQRDPLPDFVGALSSASPENEIKRRFALSARDIMEAYYLQYRGRCFSICALELYVRIYDSKISWFDPYSDGADEQFNRGTWYVMQGRGPGYQRIDITAGSRADKIQAGLLIRGLDNRDGPALALQSLIGRPQYSRKRWSDEEAGLICQIHGKRIDGTDGAELKLVQRSVRNTHEFYVAPRIGLRQPKVNASENHSYWAAAPLRIFNSNIPYSSKVYHGSVTLRSYDEVYGRTQSNVD